MLFKDPRTIDSKLLELLEKKFNVLSNIEFTDFDKDFLLLEKWFEKNKKDYYEPNDRFIVSHFDIDYYVSDYGVNLNNFLDMWEYYNIPFFTLFFYTNHVGISREINKRIEIESNDRPFIFETLIHAKTYSETGYINRNFSTDEIQCHAAYLAAGIQRSHRRAFYTYIKHLYPEKIAVSINKDEDKK